MRPRPRTSATLAPGQSPVLARRNFCVNLKKHPCRCTVTVLVLIDLKIQKAGNSRKVQPWGPSSWAAVMAFFDSGWLSEVRGSPSLISGHLYATLCEGGCQVVSVRVWKQVVCVCNIVATEAQSTCHTTFVKGLCAPSVPASAPAHPYPSSTPSACIVSTQNAGGRRWSSRRVFLQCTCVLCLFIPNS
jgi:hypothetical protein